MAQSNRFTQFPSSLARQSRSAMFGDVPVLLCHPDPEWRSPAPTVLWLHGRTANKELDPGRYMRWIRAGIAACAIDLPAHGERADLPRQTSAHTPEIIAQTVGEIDRVVEHLADPQWNGAFNLDRLGIGGMSMGGMVTLRRLCEEHTFRCAAVEGTTGNLAELYSGHAQAGKIATVDPLQHLSGWRPIPLLALHSEKDEAVPIAGMRTFIRQLQVQYQQAGSDPGMIRLHTWPETGAAQEHIGFGRVSNEAKNMQTEFLSANLGAGR